MKLRIASTLGVALILDLSGCALTGDANLSDGLAASGKRMFVTLLGKSGNLGGPSGADAYCQSDSYKPGSGTYKALLASSTRRACSTSNCSTSGEGLDWVLAPNTKYVQKGGDKEIFTTNANAIFVFGTLTNTIESSTYLVSDLFTGLTSTWQTSANTCTNWTSSSSGVNAAVGGSLITSSGAIASTTKTCNNIGYLICVEQ